jgi:hypothetical protein
MTNGLPAVLILGGLNTASRQLAIFLVSGDQGEVPNTAHDQRPPLVKYLRIADRFSVQPETTYLGPAFKRILERDDVDYRQANLAVPSKVAEVFTPPPGIESFDYVFDLTGV